VRTRLHGAVPLPGLNSIRGRGGARASPELRGLVGSMIQKEPRSRPSVNDILALPLIRDRIGQYLQPEVAQEEFSHTVLHGQRGLNQVCGFSAEIPLASEVELEEFASSLINNEKNRTRLWIEIED
jgi:hypothetical protein